MRDPRSDEELMDDFLQDAVMEIHGIWPGEDLSSDELLELNDLLTAFFTDKPVRGTHE